MYNIQMKNKVLLLILDGFGINKSKKGNAILNAKTPNLEKLYKTSISTTLKAAGIYVGLPPHIMGNSEVGHSTIGAGRRVKQYLELINDDIKSNKFFKNETIKKEILSLNKHKRNIHIMGLLSDGGVHSHIDHLFAIIKYLKDLDKNINIYIHVFSDGRDVEYKSAKKYINLLEKEITKYNNIYIADIIGRYFAMDRDHRILRTEKAYKLLTKHKGEKFKNVESLINSAYKNNITDEFIPPSFIESTPIISKKDLLIFFNFREDRARQITEMFEDNKFNILCMVKYDTYIKKYIYRKLKVEKTLSEIISDNNLKQLKIAETEKYAHVTYFFKWRKRKTI